MMADFRVYGAGDDHTLELRGMLVDAGFQVEFRDIRGQYGAENRGYLMTRGLNRIPQVFGTDGKHLGGYEDALTELGLVEEERKQAGTNR